MDNLGQLSEKTKTSSRKQRMSQLRSEIVKIPILTAKTSNIQQKIKNLSATSTPPDSSTLTQHKYAYENYSHFQLKYQTEQKLGEGTNGLVKKCYHKIKKANFAVKKLHYEEEHLRYIKDSFCYMKDIDHASIIRYNSLYLCPKTHKCLLVMELFDHPSLAEMSWVDEEELKKIAFQLISGVSELHEKQICHRDIKPENILYDQKQKILKIIDFGISRKVKIRNKKKDLLTVTGTLYYKAPQMFLGTVYDEFVDEWAIGITLYKLVSGKTPFESVYLAQTIQNIQKGQVNFEEPVWNKYSKSVKDLINRFLKPRQCRMSAEQAKKHVWFSPQIMVGMKEEIVDDSLMKKSTSSKTKLQRSITIKGDGKDIWKVQNLGMNKTKRMVKSWTEDERVVQTGYESDESGGDH